MDNLAWAIMALSAFLIIGSIFFICPLEFLKNLFPNFATEISVVVEFWKNLFPSLAIEVLGTIVTIILVDFLLKYLESKEWEKVKNRVKGSLNRELSSFVLAVYNYSAKNQAAFTKKSSSEELMKALDKKVINWLENINESKRLETGENGKKFLLNSDIYEKKREKIDRTIMKYSKHLNAELTNSLIKIQDKLGRIDHITSSKDKLEMLGNDQKTQFDMINEDLKEVLSDIWKLNQSGKIKLEF